jgi:hypothetical protein
MKTYVSMDMNGVDASYSGSILTEITILTSPYNIFLNDSNEHGYYF